MVLGNGRLRARPIETAREDEGTVETATQLCHQFLRHRGRTHRGVIKQMQIEQSKGRQFLAQRQVLGIHLREGPRVVEHPIRRQPDTHLLRANGLGDRPRHLDREPVASLNTAAEGVGTLVDVGIEELLDQVAVGRVEFHAVEAGGQRETRRLGKLRDGPRDIALGHRPHGAERLQPKGVGKHLSGTGPGDRTQDLPIRGQIRDVRHAPGMHKLDDNRPAFGMDGVGDQPPAADMLVIEKGRDAGIAQSVGRGRGGLGDDQAGRGALGVILCHQGVRGIGLDGATARHGRHDDAVVQ